MRVQLAGIRRTAFAAFALLCLSGAAPEGPAAPAWAAAAAAAQAKAPSVELPLSRVVLFSSGVGYFERRGRVEGEVRVALPFAADEVNDALKSLVVRNGPAAAGLGAPAVSYPSEESLDRALKDFRIDLSGSPSVPELLSRLRGAALALEAPEALEGRIVGVELRAAGGAAGGAAAGATGERGSEPYLVLLGTGGVRAISISEIRSFHFLDPGLEEDFERALALILESRDLKSRRLELSLPGSSAREVLLGYVLSAPVWKVSYRLDLSGEKPYFQGWAVVDNATGQDWKGVSLSLVSGRPVSFIQELYPPYYLERPVLPLAIAGAAEARSLEQGFGGDFAEAARAYEAAPPAAAPAPSAFYSMKSAEAAPERSRAEAPSGAGSSLAAAASAQVAGDQFEFTVKLPVSLDRGSSAMLPLFAGEIGAERVSIFSPDSSSVHPMLGARLSNTSGMRLPAGPITVFDGGVYAGDALLDFLAEKDKRLILFGEDLGVLGEAASTSSQETVGASLAKGVLTIQRRTVYSRSYSFRNASARPRRLVVEHPLRPGAELVEPAKPEERTAEIYRFGLDLPAAGEGRLNVVERTPGRETIALANLGEAAFLSYSSSKEIPAPVREALKKAAELKRKSEEAKRAFSDLQSRRNEIASEQNRLRQNLDAVGKDSSQGKDYLKRLMDSEAELDRLAARLNDARSASQNAQAAFESYIGNLSIE